MASSTRGPRELRFLSREPGLPLPLILQLVGLSGVSVGLLAARVQGRGRAEWRLVVGVKELRRGEYDLAPQKSVHIEMGEGTKPTS